MPTVDDMVDSTYLTTTVMPWCPDDCCSSKLPRVMRRFGLWCHSKLWKWRAPSIQPIRPASHQSHQPQTPQTSQTVIWLPQVIVHSAGLIQERHNTAMRTRTAAVCRTKAMDIADVTTLLADVPIPIEITHELTAGGMSRIFATTRRDVLVKVSDVSTSWGKYERHGYNLLEARHVPAASVLFADFKDGYLVVILERLHCTIASIIKSIVRSDAFFLDEIVRGLHHVLSTLQAARISFCDLSPDNIACRPTKEIIEHRQGVELVLIDPQFAVPTSCLSRKMGRRWAEDFDTVHLALKILAMGAVNGGQDRAMMWATKAVCAALLGYDISQRQMTRWLLRDLPMGLRLAYDALECMRAQKIALLRNASKERRT